jgi:hypothetical protein
MCRFLPSFPQLVKKYAGAQRGITALKPGAPLFWSSVPPVWKNIANLLKYGPTQNVPFRHFSLVFFVAHSEKLQYIPCSMRGHSFFELYFY